MNSNIPATTLEQIKADLRAGQKIAAIKRLREATGLGLLEAKTAVENLQAELHAKEPSVYPDPDATMTGGKGCLVVLALLVVGVALAVLLLRR